MKKYLLLAVILLPFGRLLAQDEPPHEPIGELRQQLAAARSDTARLSVLLAMADAYIGEKDNGIHNLDTAVILMSGVEKAVPFKTNRHLQGLFHLTAARFYREKGNRDTAIHHGLLATNLLQPSSLDWAKACVEIGYNYSHDDSRGDSLRYFWFQKAIPVFAAINSTDSKEWYGHTLMCLAQCHKFKPAESLALHLKALDIWRAAGHKDFRNIYSQVSRVYSTMGDQAQALNYGLLSVREDESRAKPDDFSAVTYGQMGNCYYQQGNQQEAVGYFRKALDLALQFSDTSNILTLAGNVVKCSASIGDFKGALFTARKVAAAYPPKTVSAKISEAEGFASLFYKMKQPDSMSPYVKRLLLLDASLPRNAMLRIYTQNSCMLYFNLSGKYLLAKKHAAELIRLGGLFGRIEASYGGYRQLSYADSALGNYKAAMDEYKKYNWMMDSLRSVKNTKEVAALRLQYQTEKKDKDILALNSRQQLSQLALRQAGLTRNFIIAVAALLLILLLVSFNRYRLKQRTNKSLELQQAEISKQNLSLRHLVKEKDWLVKEVHHRVKNNLQIIMSLLNSQSAYIDNEPALIAINASQHRVHAMSLIHQKLYKSENITTIDMELYIRELVLYLSDSLNTGQRIRFQLNLEPIQLDVSQTVPIGLILNEAITNSIKYAFPYNRSGVITIVFSRASGDYCFLSIADNGIGIPDHFANKKDGSLGMSLMAGLSEELEGDFAIENENGTLIKLSFLNDPDIKRGQMEMSSVVSMNY
jgi:two-component sensor histidine kinase